MALERTVADPGAQNILKLGLWAQVFIYFRGVGFRGWVMGNETKRGLKEH